MEVQEINNFYYLYQQKNKKYFLIGKMSIKK